VPEERQGAWLALLAEGFEGEISPSTPLGLVTASAELVLRHGDEVVLHLPVTQLNQVYEEAIPRRMRQAGLPPDR
jgi:hypothetical protein